MAISIRILVVLLIAIVLVSFGWHKTPFQDSLKKLLQSCRRPLSEEKDETPPLSTRTELQDNIVNLFEKIQRLIPEAPFTYLNRTTSGKNSKASIVNPKQQYCVGEDLVVQIDMYDYVGNRKTYGGDFIRPRLFSPDLGAAVSGRVEDFNNGSYHIHFPLYWEGKSKVSILLFHSSEGVAALWRSRQSSLGVIGFYGKFEKFGKETTTPCSFELEEKEGKEICEYLDPVYEEAFYCYKVTNFTCESLNEMKCFYLSPSYLTPGEREMFQRYNVLPAVQS